MADINVTLEQIYEARERLRGIVKHTSLEHAEGFSQMAGCEVFLKLENMQKTGSFKLRGAYNKIAASEKDLVRGVVAASAGNHAQGVAYASSKAGIQATIVMPEGAPITKVEATRSYGAKVVLAGQDYDQAFAEAQKIQQETGAVFVHAFNDPLVIAGQGTVGLELLEDLPDLDTVLVPIGGGGLISGLACAIKALKPEVRIIGVEASDAPCMLEACRLGQIHELKSAQTIADGIAVRKAGELTFEMTRRYVDDIVTVDDEEIAWAIITILERSNSLLKVLEQWGLLH
ncbi:hypothetical protein N752_04825 [Desulforamulus aquiferis]|nr:hypothetical protein N752_04825 [Desulforamulus aquiferis]